MSQPPEFSDPNLPTHVCKLRKALYGLKQAPCSWYEELSTFLLTKGFVNVITNASLFNFCNGGDIIYFLVYVEDLIITDNNMGIINQFIHTLAHQFSVKDLGFLYFFLSVEVHHTKDGLFLSQQRYIHDLLVKAKMEGAKDISTPLSTANSLVLSDGSSFTDVTVFRQLVVASSTSASLAQTSPLWSTSSRNSCIARLRLICRL